MQIELKDLTAAQLNRPALEELTAQVINQLNAIADPLVRYAVARTLFGVFDMAKSDAAAAAVDHCLVHEIGLDNEHFTHDGLEFNMDYHCDYNYGDNDTDEDGDPAGYKEASRKLKDLDKQVKSYKKKLSAAKDLIELAHPNMQPINPEWTIKFYMKEV